MEEGNEKLGGSERTEKEDIYSKAIRAGKRTYFFDVKSTRRNDFYLTITESKKRFNREGRYFFEKHKIFLYKEDFDKFVDGLTEMVDYIRQHQEDFINYEGLEHEEEFRETTLHDTGNSELEEVEVASYSNIDFDDLDEKR
ncbi:MAG: PUR family DNA/RNA-binding protein [Bacteroidetes bacterium]|nr:PUR family DNA/RNA-binding protein [Bacteroidales bacterium]NJO69763.1 PUR family DNA/RNA-binding protein [Bacteroidota bacterium]